MKLGLMVLVAMLGGCGTHYRAATIPTESPDLAYKAAVRAMVANGQTLESRDPLVGLVLGQWGHYPAQGAEYRIRIVTDTETVVSIDCRNRMNEVPCDRGTRSPDSLVQAATAIAAEIRAAQH